MLTGAERGSVHPRKSPDAIRRLVTLLSADLLAASSVVRAVVTLVVSLLLIAACGSGGQEFEAKIALRYATQEGRTVLLEVAPFDVGANRLRITVLDSNERPVAANAKVRLSRLESNGLVDEETTHPVDQDHLESDVRLDNTGWWQTEVVLGERESASFYFRLDPRAKPPLEIAPPDYQSDANAEGVYQHTLENYSSLNTLKWREELTSGLLAPTGIGAWVVTDGEAQRPDRVHYHVLSPGSSDYDTYHVGATTCSLDRGESWQCSSASSSNVLNLDYLRPTAFALGREDVVDGENAQVVLFYNPGQQAWFAWWVGSETGYLRRQMMVAPGHYMLTEFFDQNVPFAIEIPSEAQVPGG